MMRPFVQFKAVQSRQFFYIDETAWIKCPSVRQVGDTTFNAYSLEKTDFSCRKSSTVDVRLFDECTLVQIDPKLPCLADDPINFIKPMVSLPNNDN